MAKRKCTHSFVGHQCEGDRIVSILCAVAGCNERLSLGPSNDEPDLVACEISRAAWVRSDAGWARFEERGAFSWDVTRPLAEQWPWNGQVRIERWSIGADEDHGTVTMGGPADASADEHIALTGPTDQGQLLLDVPLLTDAEAAAVIAQSSDSFEPRDYAATTPWADPGASTRMTDDELVATVAYAPPGSVRKTCEGPDGEPTRHGSNG